MNQVDFGSEIMEWRDLISGENDKENVSFMNLATIITFLAVQSAIKLQLESQKKNWRNSQSR